MVGPQRLLPERERPLSKWDRLSVLEFTRELDDLGVERVGIVGLLRLGGWSENERPSHHKCGYEPRQTHHARPFPQSDDPTPSNMPRGVWRRQGLNASASELHMVKTRRPKDRHSKPTKISVNTCGQRL